MLCLEIILVCFDKNVFLLYCFFFFIEFDPSSANDHCFSLPLFFSFLIGLWYCNRFILFICLFVGPKINPLYFLYGLFCELQARSYPTAPNRVTSGGRYSF